MNGNDIVSSVRFYDPSLEFMNHCKVKSCSVSPYPKQPISK